MGEEIDQVETIESNEHVEDHEDHNVSDDTSIPVIEKEKENEGYTRNEIQVLNGKDFGGDNLVSDAPDNENPETDIVVESKQRSLTGRSWRSPKDIASSVRRLQQTKKADDNAALFLGGSAISLEGSLELPEADLESDVDDMSSYYRRPGGPPTNIEIHHGNPTVVIDDYPQSPEEMSLSGRQNVGTHTGPSKGNNNNSGKEAWEEDENVSSMVKVRRSWKICLTIIVILLMMALAALIAMYVTSQSNNKSASAVQSPEPSPSLPTVTTSPTSTPTLSAVQTFNIPIEMTLGNTPALTGLSVVTFEQNTADYIHSGLQEDLLLVDATVGVDVVDQEFIDKPLDFDVEFYRANDYAKSNVSFTEATWLNIYLETTISFRSTDIFETDTIHGLLEDLFNIEAGLEEYLEELQSTNDETFQNTHHVSVNIGGQNDQQPTKTPSAAPNAPTLTPTPAVPTLPPVNSLPTLPPATVIVTSTPTVVPPTAEPTIILTSIPVTSTPTFAPSALPTLGSIGKGFAISNNDNYEPGDVTKFTVVDTIYMRIWWESIDYNNMRKAEYELKIDGWKYKGDLTNHYNGFFSFIWNGGLDEPVGWGEIKLKIEDNKRKYEVKDVEIVRRKA